MTVMKIALKLNFWITLVITSDVMRQTHSIAWLEERSYFTPGTKHSSVKVAQNATLATVALSPHEINKWTKMLAWTQEVASFMMCGNCEPVHGNQNNFILIYTEELAVVKPLFEEIFSCRWRLTKAVAWRLDASSRRQDVLQVLSTSLGMETEVRSVIVASRYVDFVYLVLDVVATDLIFKWRRLLHVIEWFALTTDRLSGSSNISRHKSLPDFVTFLSSQDLSIDINQKSRIQPLKKVLQIRLNLNESSFQGNVGTKWSPRLKLNKVALGSLNESMLSQHLRRDATIYLASQKSTMAGMHVPAVIVTSEWDQNAFLVNEGHKTSWRGFSIDVLKLLGEALGFTPQLFPVMDGGFYGTFESNEEILGVSGERSFHCPWFAMPTVIFTWKSLCVCVGGGVRAKTNNEHILHVPLMEHTCRIKTINISSKTTQIMPS